jgi:hypothetical protein
MIRRYLSVATVATVAAALAGGGSALADEALRLQGLFCNSEAQIDQALADIAAGLSPRRAADLANRDAVVCTYVDRIEYLIAPPSPSGTPRCRSSSTAARWSRYWSATPSGRSPRRPSSTS